MEMLRNTQDACAVAPWPSVHANALLESFAIHARCLDEFFRARRQEGTRMRASDFVPGFPLLVSSGRILGRMNAEVTHLTHSRRRPEGRPGWDLAGIARPLIEKAVPFLQEIIKDGVLMGAHDNRRRAETLLASFNLILTKPVIRLATTAATASLAASSTDKITIWGPGQMLGASTGTVEPTGDVGVL
jgi:hypothetical protein